MLSNESLLLHFCPWYQAVILLCRCLGEKAVLISERHLKKLHSSSVEFVLICQSFRFDMFLDPLYGQCEDL